MVSEAELREAAERLRNGVKSYPWPCDMHEQPAQRSADLAALANAWLAERDETPLTDEWAAGVKLSDGAYFIKRVGDWWELHGRNSGWLSYVPTVGQLRTACRLFGITLEEPRP